jgi:hypothetical protein
MGKKCSLKTSIKNREDETIQVIINIYIGNVTRILPM